MFATQPSIILLDLRFSQRFCLTFRSFVVIRRVVG